MRDHPGVTHVDRFRTMFVGPKGILVAADVSFDPELVTDDITRNRRFLVSSQNTVAF